MQQSPHPLLVCHALAVTVPGRSLVENLDLSLERGDFLAILGRNGAGKTLTMHTLAGLRAPTAGTIALAGEPLAALARRQIARQLALLPQDTDDVFPATVMETVLAGRHPHIAALEWESAADRRIAQAALDDVGLADFADRELGTLSGGERRRVAIAQVLAQDPGVLLLDEPSNHLDPQHQLQVLRLLSSQAISGKAVVASLHDVNLAARFANRCLLLHGDGSWQLGASARLLSESNLSRLYCTPMEAVPWHGGQLFIAADSR